MFCIGHHCSEISLEEKEAKFYKIRISRRLQGVTIGKKRWIFKGVLAAIRSSKNRIQSTISKTDTFVAEKKCPSYGPVFDVVMHSNKHMVHNGG